MDQALRTLTRAAAQTADRETLLRLAAAKIRGGELVALTEVVFAPPRRSARTSCTRSRSQPRVYVLREPDSGELTQRVRNTVMHKVLELLGRPAVRARWTATAGCTCGCSPGFILRGRGADELGDTYVRVLIARSETNSPRATAPREPWRLVPHTPAPILHTPPGPPVRAASTPWPTAFQGSADRTLPPTRVGPPPATPIAAAQPTSRRLPPVGTVLRKFDRRGGVRCEATVEADGVRFRGTRYPSLSAAALAAARSIGLATKSLNGWAWWGLENPRAARRPRRATPAPTPPTPPCAACGGTHGLLRCPDMGR